MLSAQIALNQFWNSFGVPAYPEGSVPDGAKFPYITFRVRQGDTFTSSQITAYNWHQDKGQGVNSERGEMLDKIAAAIPPGGRRLKLDIGFILLQRNTASWQGLYDDANDKSVKGGRTAILAFYYTY